VISPFGARCRVSGDTPGTSSDASLVAVRPTSSWGQTAQGHPYPVHADWW